MTTTQPVIINPNALYDYEQLGDALRICKKTVRRMVECKELPSPFKQGRKWYWHGSTLHAHFRAEQDKAITGRAS